MTSPPQENVLRDFLSKNLHLVEPGLALVDTEVKLPNRHGASGFVDIYARDQFGAHIVIELKRSDASARQALHELYKYTALFANNHGLAEAQVRCVLISTTWHELLVPFSNFAATSRFDARGLQLTLDEQGVPVTCSPVQLLAPVMQREVCPKHHVLLYSTAAARDEAVGRVEAALSSLSIDSYFFLLVDYAGASSRVIFPAGIYVVLAAFDNEERLRLEQRYPEEFHNPSASDWDHEEIVFAQLWDKLRPDDAEIGYPQKLLGLLESWKISGLSRSGLFASETIWTQPDLIDIATAAGDGYGERLAAFTTPKHSQAWNRILEGVDHFLSGTGVWAIGVRQALEEVAIATPDAAVSINIYNPRDLVFVLSRPEELVNRYWPGLEIIVQSGDGLLSIILGSLWWDGRTRPRDVTTSIGSAYSGGLDEWMAAHHGGETPSYEEMMCLTHGLSYRLLEFRYDHQRVRSMALLPSGKGLTRRNLAPKEPKGFDATGFLRANRDYLDSLRRRVDRITLFRE